MYIISNHIHFIYPFKYIGMSTPSLRPEVHDNKSKISKERPKARPGPRDPEKARPKARPGPKDPVIVSAYYYGTYLVRPVSQYPTPLSQDYVCRIS